MASVYALQGGAHEVVSVDSSAKAITLTDANVALNFPATLRHSSSAEDAFKYLDAMDSGRHDLYNTRPAGRLLAQECPAQRSSGATAA